MSAASLTSAPQSPGRDAACGFQAAEDAVLARYGVVATTRYVELADPALRVRLLESGEGPPVLLVPGDGAVAAAWAPLIAELHGYHAIVLDRPSFGASDRFEYRGCDLRRHGVALLHSLLDALGVDALPIIGSSGGAQWSLWLAIDAPQRVTRLVPMGAPAVCLPGFHPLPPMRMLTVPGLGQLLARMPAPNAKATGKMLAKTDARLLDHPEIVELYHAAGKLPGYGSSVAAIFQRSMRPGGFPRASSLIGDDELRGLIQPTLFVYGEEEPFGPPALATRAAALMPDARVELVARGWHHPWLADATGVGRAVREFLAVS